MRTKQRFFRARADGDIRAAQFHRIERIARRLLQLYVPGNDRDCGHASIGRAQSHDERDSVIRRSVGINQKGAGHGR